MINRSFERAVNNASRALRVTWLMAVSLMGAGHLAMAAAPAATPAQAPTALASGTQPVTSRSYTVLRGETLDRVIQKNLSGSPLKIELLRKAFLDLNPQAFVNGNVTRPRPGAVLQVPDHVQLLRATILPLLEGAEAAAMAADGRPVSARERRSWVRFP